MTEVAAPLRRRWGVGADPAPQACEPFSYAGSFDGLAQKSEVSSLWGTSGWFAGGSPDTAATTQRESATLLATAPSEPAVAPGGAVSQNRLTTGATLRQPFAPTSAQRTLAESVQVPDAHEMSHTAAVFDVTAGRAGRSSFTGRSHKLADGRPGHAGWTYRHETSEWVSATGHVLRLPPADAVSPLVHDTCPDVRESSSEDMEVAGVVLGPVRAARMQRFDNALPEPRSGMPCSTAPRAAARPAPLESMPRRAFREARRAPAPQCHMPAAAPAPACVWTQFRMACGTLVYVHAGDITPALALAWTTGEAPWPALCALSLDAIPRAAGRLHGHMPGPELGDEATAAARAEIGAWAEQAAEEHAELRGEPMEEEADEEVCQLRRQLEAAHAWAARLELALAAAGVPLPVATIADVTGS